MVAHSTISTGGVVVKAKKQMGLSIFLAASLLLGSVTPVWAMDFGHTSGGIYNEKEYQEVIFVTGKPVVVTGTMDVRQSVRNGTGTVTLRFDLENVAKDVELTRNITFSVTEEKRSKQTITNLKITSFSESIDVGENKYELDDYQFTKSVIIDDQPAADYFTGNWSGKKIYKFNDEDGTVEVFSQGSSVGYENPWSSTETQNISGTVSFDGKISVGDAVYSDDWSGTFSTDVTYSTGSKINYEANDLLAISFPGGYVMIQEAGSALKYSCRLPEMDKNGISEKARDSWSDTLSTDSFPVYNRLPVYSFSDMSGHWAKEDVGIITGLGIMSAGNYFGPSIKMTRGEFARALARTLELTEEETQTTQKAAPRFQLPWGTPSGGEDSQEESLFDDVSEDSTYYKDIKAVYENGLLSGTGNGCFSPDTPLTKAQAVVACIRALGFQNQGMSYATQPFRDDGSIPSWAKEAYYTAYSIGLVSPDAFGYANPNQVLTRAEAASMMHRFIQYLQDDLRYEYRDRLLNY